MNRINWPCDEDLMALYEEGFTLAEIAGGLGCSSGAVHYVLRDITQMRPKSPKKTGSVQKRLRKMSDEDFSYYLEKAKVLDYSRLCMLLGISVSSSNYKNIDERIAKMGPVESY